MPRPKATPFDKVLEYWDHMNAAERADTLEYLKRDHERCLKIEARLTGEKNGQLVLPSPESKS